MIWIPCTRSATGSRCWPSARCWPPARSTKSSSSITRGCRNISTARARAPPAAPATAPHRTAIRWKPDMETRANYVLIGAFTIAVVVFGLLFALWAAKFASDRSWQEYAVLFNEPVTGLSEGSSVQYNGIAVGTVQSLQLSPDDPREVIAMLRVDARAPVKADTQARLSITSLTGPPIIQLTGGSPEAPWLVETTTREVPIIPTAPSALQNIADTANRMVERLDGLLSEENITRIENT